MTLIIIFGAIFLVWLSTLVYRYRETVREQGRDQARYTEGSRIFMRDGQVICFACKGKGTVARRVVGPTHVRRHFCVSCGMGLFYSSVRTEQAHDGFRFPSMNPEQ
jgi:hypothetical protein